MRRIRWYNALTTTSVGHRHEFFFILNYKTFPIFRGFEQLSCSICWRVMVFSQNGQGDGLLWDLNFYPKYSLASKKLEPKNGCLGWRPGPGDLGQKNAQKKLITSPTTRLKPKTYKFFKIETGRLPESVESLASSPNPSMYIRIHQCTVLECRMF